MNSSFMLLPLMIFTQTGEESLSFFFAEKMRLLILAFTSTIPFFIVSIILLALLFLALFFIVRYYQMVKDLKIENESLRSERHNLQFKLSQLKDYAKDKEVIIEQLKEQLHLSKQADLEAGEALREKIKEQQSIIINYQKYNESLHYIVAELRKKEVSVPKSTT